MLALIKAKIEPMTRPPPPGPYASSSGNDEQAHDDASELFISSSISDKAPTVIENIADVGKSGKEPKRQKDSSNVEDETELERMRGVLDSMLGKLQTRIQAAEQALDGKIQLLDEDRDGVISSTELKNTMKKILKRYPTDAEAEAFVLLLDEDRDGTGELQKIRV